MLQLNFCNAFVGSEEECTNLEINGNPGTWTAIYLDCDDYGGTRGVDVCGDDMHTPWFSLGDCNDQSGLVHTFIDTNVLDGLEYTYSITAYDMGITPDYILNYNESLGILDTTYSSANPLHFATPDGYQHIETGKGTSVNDKNFITIKPGPQASDVLGNDIKVVPNPYIVSSNYNESEYKRQIRFTNLPAQCTIRIYTLAGEAVSTINHDDTESGNAWWDMRSINNQEIAPGLYIFHVEETGKSSDPFIGKFAVIR